jgi:hypothetical protein
MPKDKDKELLEKWKESELWPVIDEHATAISGSDGKKTGFHNFCPEVSFDVFHVFASYLHRFADEIDRDNRHAQLADKPKKIHGDWRWTWEHIEPMHYTDCPVFAILSASAKTARSDRERDELLQLRPGAFGININLKALWKRLPTWFPKTYRFAPRPRPAHERSANSDLGLLDYLANAHEGLRSLTGIAKEVGNWFRQINPQVEATSNVLLDKASSFDKKRAKVRKLASRIDQYAKWLGTANEEYARSVIKIEEGFGAMFSGEFIIESEARQGIQNFIEVMNQS